MKFEKEVGVSLPLLPPGLSMGGLLMLSFAVMLAPDIVGAQ